MTSEREEQPAAPQPHNGGPGKTLAAQREAMGWTVEQVAEQLKLAVRQVVALEAGDYQALPSPAVTRGFVRAYAKILKLDAAPLVAQIEMDNPSPADSGAPALRRDKPASFSEVRFPSHGRRSTLPLGWIAAAVVVAAAAGAAWHFGLIPALQHGEPAASTATTTVPVAEGAASATLNGAATDTLQSASVPLISVPAPAADGAATPDGSAANPAGTAATLAGVTPAAGAATPPAAVAPATNAAVTPPAPAPAAPGAAPAAAAAGANPLVFTVSEDTWIDVRPAKGGKPLASRLVKAGSTETFDVTEPLKVVVGNTHGVTATLRGAPVALPGKTARVNLK